MVMCLIILYMVIAGIWAMIYGHSGDLNDIICTILNA